MIWFESFCDGSPELFLWAAVTGLYGLVSYFVGFWLSYRHFARQGAVP